MNNEEAIEFIRLLKIEALTNMVLHNQGTHAIFSNNEIVEFADIVIEALEKINRIQEIMAMPIQENAVKYLAMCEVMNND